jgi:pimeloyl-ACP methyl ester carboxylesterase
VTLLFLHGAGFTGDVFDGLRAAFPDSHAPNLPGHLREGEPESMAEFAAFAAGYARDRGLQDLVLCGHSMGGAIAIETALSGGLSLRALVLLGSGARLRVAPAFLQGIETDFHATAREIAGYFFAANTPERVEWAAQSMERVGQAQTLRDFRACDAFDALDRLGGIGVPVLALTGEADRMTPPKYAQALADRVPAGQARRVTGAGHLLMVERPAETIAEIRTFLSGLP